MGKDKKEFHELPPESQKEEPTEEEAKKIASRAIEMMGVRNRKQTGADDADEARPSSAEEDDPKTPKPAAVFLTLPNFMQSLFTYHRRHVNFVLHTMFFRFW